MDTETCPICDIHTDAYHCADCHAEAIVDSEVQFQTVLIDDEDGFRYVCEDCLSKAAGKALREDHDGFYAASAHHAAVKVSDLFTTHECNEIARGLTMLGRQYKAEAGLSGHDWQNSRERQRMLRLLSIFNEAAEIF